MVVEELCGDPLAARLAIGVMSALAAVTPGQPSRLVPQLDLHR